MPTLPGLAAWHAIRGESQVVMRGYWKTLCLLFALLGGASSAPLHATVPAGISPEQIRMYQQLPPEQQASMLQMLQKPGATASSEPPPTSPDVVIPMPAADNKAKEIRSPASLALQPFGYDLFAGTPTTFAPATDIPVPSDYVIGPGDVVQVQLFGKENIEYSLAVNREGMLSFPGLGAISVAGSSFAEVKEMIRSRVAKQFIGVQANVSMGPLRSIRIFVLGDANRPGSYTVSALSTMTNALFVSGGIKTIGSLRNIQLKRAGKVVTTLDLYDLLLRGDTSSDRRLQPGDVIFIPSVGSTIGIAGEVLRPAIYELRQEKSIGEALGFCGGLLPSANREVAQLERITEGRDLTVLDINLTESSSLRLSLKDGDVIRVHPINEVKDAVVTVSGHVYRSGDFQWKPDLRLSDLMGFKDLRPDADLHYLVIVREIDPARRIQTFSVDLEAALAKPKSDQDPLLQARDRILVFASSSERGGALANIIQQLNMQAEQGSPRQVVRINGRIRHSGEYPLERGMRVSDLLRAGGHLQESAYVLSAELTRYHVADDKSRVVEHVTLDLAGIIDGKVEADLQLQPYDHINIKELPRWRDQRSVKILGEVAFPGEYPVRTGETLRDVLKRAGGLTQDAYPSGAIFTRKELRDKEQNQLSQMAATLEMDLAALTVEQMRGDPEKLGAITALQDMLKRMRQINVTGRLVIDLPAIMADVSDADVVMQANDVLFVPGYKQEVTVVGEVFHPTSHLFDKSLSIERYVNLSGGTTKRADDDRTYIVRANGSVLKAKAGFFSRQEDIQPGDTIVVPLDAERFSRLQLWTNVSQIVYQLGIAAASWKTVGVF